MCKSLQIISVTNFCHPALQVRRITKGLSGLFKMFTCSVSSGGSLYVIFDLNSIERNSRINAAKYKSPLRSNFSILAFPAGRFGPFFGLCGREFIQLEKNITRLDKNRSLPDELESWVLGIRNYWQVGDCKYVILKCNRFNVRRRPSMPTRQREKKKKIWSCLIAVENLLMRFCIGSSSGCADSISEWPNQSDVVIISRALSGYIAMAIPWMSFTLYALNSYMNWKFFVWCWIAEVFKKWEGNECVQLPCTNWYAQCGFGQVIKRQKYGVFL